MLKSGTLTVDAEGTITLDAVSANGSALTGTYNIATAIEETSLVKKAMKQIRDGQVILVNPAGEEFNILGTRIN